VEKTALRRRKKGQVKKGQEGRGKVKEEKGKGGEKILPK